MLLFNWNRIPNIDYLITSRIDTKISPIKLFCVALSISLYNDYEFDYFRNKNH